MKNLHAGFRRAVLAVLLGLGAGSAAAADTETRHVDSGGLERDYLVHVPPGYNPGVKTALVLVFHGGGGNAENIAKSTRYAALADREGFIVAFPSGLGRVRGGTWNAGSDRGEGYAEKRKIDDVGFVRAVLADLKRSYAIDERRIYAAGMSKGGMFAYSLACNMPEELAAIAAVSATMTDTACRPSGPVAILHIHGTADENVPFDGGAGRLSMRGADYPPVNQTLAFWQNVNGCSRETVRTFSGADTTCTAYRACRKDIELCMVQNGGHAWPGMTPARWQKKAGYYVTQDYDATAKSWEFFKAHPR